MEALRLIVEDNGAWHWMKNPQCPLEPGSLLAAVENLKASVLNALYQQNAVLSQQAKSLVKGATPEQVKKLLVPGGKIGES